MLNDQAYEAAGLKQADQEVYRRHPSLALGNEICLISELPAPLAFGGDLHGKFRSIVGNIGGLVDLSALPADIQTVWTQLREKQREYVGHVKILRTMVDAASASDGKERLYTDLHILSEYASQIDPHTTQQELTALAEIQRDYYKMFEKARKAFDAYGTIPLRLKISSETEKPERYITTVLTNICYDQISLLRMLMADRLLKDSQASDLKTPMDISDPEGQEKVMMGIESEFFSRLKYTPEAQTFAQALNTHIAEDVAHYLERLDKYYGKELQTSYPQLYEDFSDIKKRLACPHELRDLPPINMSAGSASKCPHLRQMFGSSGSSSLSQ
jgi:hypothetical protein